MEPASDPGAGLVAEPQASRRLLLAAAGIAGVDRLLHGLVRTTPGQQRNDGFPKEVLSGADIPAGAT